MTLPPPTSLTFTRQLRPGQIRGTLPDAEWSTFLHPGGWSYYYHATDRVITDIDITDPSKYWPLQQRFDSRFYHDQVAWTRTQPHLAAEWELWIGDKGARWVDHATFSASELDQPASRFGELASANTLHMEERYWEFLQAHPCHRQAPVGASMHVEDVLTWSCTDQTLFNTSSSSFTKEQSQELLSTLRSLPDPELRPDERTKSYARAVRTWLVSAISRQIARDRIEMHYGRPSARAFREKERQNELTHLSDLALHGSSYTIFFIFSSILLFGTPTSYLRRIMDVDRRRFDSGVNQTRWRLFLQGLLKDWTDSNLLATVLIAATVAFIAIQGIDNISRILTLVSVLLAIASVLTGQYLTREHQPRLTSNALTGLQYFQNAHSAFLLSLILSLPLTFLSWSFITFICALIVFSIRSSDGGADSSVFGTPTWGVVVSATGLLVISMLVIGWMFWGIWDRSSSSSSQIQIESKTNGYRDSYPNSNSNGKSPLPSPLPFEGQGQKKTKVTFGGSGRAGKNTRKATVDSGGSGGSGGLEAGESPFASQITHMNPAIVRRV